MLAESYHWSDARRVLTELAREHDFEVDAERRTFEAPGLEIAPPRVVPWPFAGPPDADETVRERAERLRREREATSTPLQRYVDAIPESLPRQCVVILQAGAASIAYFEAGIPVSTKSMKRYVVRGKGRAQPTYLASKGRSRYGSRLRLQNARRLHDEVNARLAALWSEYGPPAQLFVSAPARLWSEQFEGQVKPPFERDQPIERIGRDLPVPTTDVLLRAYRSLEYGRIHRSETTNPPPTP